MFYWTIVFWIKLGHALDRPRWRNRQRNVYRRSEWLSVKSWKDDPERTGYCTYESGLGATIYWGLSLVHWFGFSHILTTTSSCANGFSHWSLLTSGFRAAGGGTSPVHPAVWGRWLLARLEVRLDRCISRIYPSCAATLGVRLDRRTPSVAFLVTLDTGLDAFHVLTIIRLQPPKKNQMSTPAIFWVMCVV